MIQMTSPRAHPVNDRIDAVDHDPLGGEVRYVLGTPAACPTAPPVADGWRRMAEVYVPAEDGSFPRRRRPCRRCHATGEGFEGGPPCAMCRGTGEHVDLFADPTFISEGSGDS